MKWAILYVTVVLLANYTATWFIPIFGLVAVGTILFGVTFTARDQVHYLGRSKVYMMIAIAAISSATLAWAGATSYRIIIASITAIVISEAIDTEIYQQLLVRRWIVRVAGSNVISIPVDTILFNLMSFWGVFSTSMLVSIVTGEVVVKYIIGILVAFVKVDRNA